ncbi:hypothetical protein TNCV_4364701, partial [Trichonephila clavipes]
MGNRKNNDLVRKSENLLGIVFTERTKPLDVPT